MSASLQEITDQRAQSDITHKDEVEVTTSNDSPQNEPFTFIQCYVAEKRVTWGTRLTSYSDNIKSHTLYATKEQLYQRLEQYLDVPESVEERKRRNEEDTTHFANFFIRFIVGAEQNIDTENLHLFTIGNPSDFPKGARRISSPMSIAIEHIPKMSIDYKPENKKAINIIINPEALLKNNSGQCFYSQDLSIRPYTDVNDPKLEHNFWNTVNVPLIVTTINNNVCTIIGHCFFPLFFPNTDVEPEILNRFVVKTADAEQRIQKLKEETSAWLEHNDITTFQGMEKIRNVRPAQNSGWGRNPELSKLSVQLDECIQFLLKLYFSKTSKETTPIQNQTSEVLFSGRQLIISAFEWYSENQKLIGMSKTSSLLGTETLEVENNLQLLMPDFVAKLKNVGGEFKTRKDVPSRDKDEPPSKSLLVSDAAKGTSAASVASFASSAAGSAASSAAASVLCSASSATSSSSSMSAAPKPKMEQ